MELEKIRLSDYISAFTLLRTIFPKVKYMCKNSQSEYRIKSQCKNEAFLLVENIRVRIPAKQHVSAADGTTIACEFRFSKKQRWGRTKVLSEPKEIKR